MKTDRQSHRCLTAAEQVMGGVGAVPEVVPSSLYSFVHSVPSCHPNSLDSAFLPLLFSEGRLFLFLGSGDYPTILTAFWVFHLDVAHRPLTEL